MDMETATASDSVTATRGSSVVSGKSDSTSGGDSWAAAAAVSSTATGNTANSNNSANRPSSSLLTPPPRSSSSSSSSEQGLLQPPGAPSRSGVVNNAGSRNNGSFDTTPTAAATGGPLPKAVLPDYGPLPDEPPGNKQSSNHLAHAIFTPTTTKLVWTKIPSSPPLPHYLFIYLLIKRTSESLCNLPRVTKHNQWTIHYCSRQCGCC
jgi:hypothetical protein